MSDLEDRIDDLESRMNDLESEQDETGYQVNDMHSDFIIFRSKTAGEIERIKKVLALATSPDPADLEKFKMLREAYDKYEFTRNMILGTNDAEKD